MKEFTPEEALKFANADTSRILFNLNLNKGDKVRSIKSPLIYRGGTLQEFKSEYEEAERILKVQFKVREARVATNVDVEVIDNDYLRLVVTTANS